MPTWTVRGEVLRVLEAGEVLRLRVELAPAVLVMPEVRLATPGAPHEPLRVSPGARAKVEQLVPPATRVVFVSDRLDRWKRPLGRLLIGVGRQDLAGLLLRAGLAVPARRRLA